MWFLMCLSLLSALMQISFATLSLAAGLYYLAELVEEYTLASSRVIKWMIIFVAAANVGLLCVENLPFYMPLGGLLAQACHYGLMHKFPAFATTSPAFLGAIVMFLANHYAGLQFFSNDVTYEFSFADAVAYFLICQWLVPLAFFVSLSANDLTLPTMNDSGVSFENVVGSPPSENNNFLSRKKAGGMVTSLFKTVGDALCPWRQHRRS